MKVGRRITHALEVLLRVVVVGLVVGSVLGAVRGPEHSAPLEVVLPPAADPPVTDKPPTWGDPGPTVVVVAPAPETTTALPAPPPPTAPAFKRATPTSAKPTNPGRVASSTSRAARPTPPPPADPAGIAPYRGLGTWVDVYDWSQTYTRDGAPSVGPDTVDRMADEGVQTIFIQASKQDAPSDVLEPDRLTPIIDRAHRLGLRVVAWYLPTLEDPAKDLQRLVAIASLDVEGVAVDIESRAVSDVSERNRRLVQLSTDLRSSLPGRAIGGIVLPPVVLEEVNPNYWPNFPYHELAPLYDVWQPMAYWTNRKSSSGWRDAHAYTSENVIRLRRDLGLPDAPVSLVGGIGDHTTTADVDGFRRASAETSCIGGGLYDWRTTGAALWPGMRGFRS